MLSKQRISNVVEKWYLLEPLFFAVWTTHELVINSNIQTIRVGQGKIEYNPAFIETLDDKTLYQVLQFEAMRMILKHPYLRRRENAQVAYLASNITIQEYLNTPLPFPRAKDIFQHENFNQKYFEFYYQELLEKTSATCPNELSGAGGSGATDESSKDRSSGQGENQSTGDANHSETVTQEQEDWDTDPELGGEDLGEQNRTDLEKYTDSTQTGAENTEAWDANEYHANQINDKIENVQQGHFWGTVPARIQELILATLKPKVNYRDVLRSFRATILSVRRVLTRMRPSRRYEFLYMGSRRDFCTKLLFAVDVSGSVSSADLRRAFSIVNRFFKYGVEQVNVIQFDTEVKGPPLVLKKAKSQVAVIGRGGTNFQAVIDYIDQTEKDYDGLIIFTDGYAPIPTPSKNKHTRILWLFNNERNYLSLEKQIQSAGLGRATFVKE